MIDMHNFTIILKNLFGYIQFITDYYNFKRIYKNKRFLMSYSDRWVCISDNTGNTSFDHHYIYHIAWAARILSVTKPELHVDISSSLYFCTLISAFIKTDFYDYRPADISLSNLKMGCPDLTSLHFHDNSLQSLSCMHTIEHIGLGRYGDPIDPEGDLKAINELKRVLAPGGNLLFVVPIGKEAKIQFNAHRIYTYNQILSYFNDLDLIEFSLIADNPNLDDFIENADPNLTELCSYGCGCFWFKKEENKCQGC